jgi:pyridoxine/pyridoxamine 5'-phosphate oxidase
MADKSQEKNADNEVPLEKKLDDLYTLIDGIEVAQFTTRRADGHLVSRPMQVQRRVSGSDLWFMTNGESHKLEELATDPHVNCAFYNGPHARVGERERHGRDQPRQAAHPRPLPARLARVARRRGRRARRRPDDRASRSCSSRRTR